MKHHYGSSAYTHFRRNYSEQDIFSESDIDKIFEEISRSFGLRGFDEIFRGARTNGTRTFKFYRNGAAGRGYVFTSGFGGKANHGKGEPSLRFPRKGLLGKVAQYAFKALSGLDEITNKGKDIVDIIRLSPHQARTGGPHEYTNWRRNKKIVIRIPPNIREGQKIRIPGQGEEGNPGTEAGDLYLKVYVKKPILDRLATMIASFKK
jgi:curved DNA-binding protein CbpA